MKTIFKVLNIFLIVVAVIALISAIATLVGGNKLLNADGSNSPMAGAGMMMLLIYELPAIASALLTFFAAHAGLTSRSDRCGKLATIILILVIINFVFAIFNGGMGGAIFQLLFYGFYFYLAKQPSNY